jgi:hypothetical protein
MSIMELVAKGKQDEDLIDMNNMNSVFDYSINKTNKYSKGDIIYYPVGKANWGNTIRFNIERQGDLLYGLYIIVKLPKLSINNLGEDENDDTSEYRVKYSDFIGNTIIEKVSLYFNGQLIDEQWGEYMQLYTDLYISDWNRKAMIGMDDYINKPNLKINSEYVYIPLNFWFCNNINQPLPIIAMQYTEIYIDVKFRRFVDCHSVLRKDITGLFYLQDIKHPQVDLEDVKLQANYYYVDLEERKKLAQQEYQILITQCQLKSTELKTSTTLEIDYNHVIKDIFFFIRPKEHIEYGEFFNFSTKTENPPNELINIPISTTLWDLEPKRHLLKRARILFNSIERVEWRDAKYFYNMQNYENYQNTIKSHIYMYSFNIEPTNDDSLCGCNFSRLDNAQLQVEIEPNLFIVKSPNIKYPEYKNYELFCFATNFNFLIIKNGLTGVKYSN